MIVIQVMRKNIMREKRNHVFMSFSNPTYQTQIKAKLLDSYWLHGIYLLKACVPNSEEKKSAVKEIEPPTFLIKSWNISLQSIYQTQKKIQIPKWSISTTTFYSAPLLLIPNKSCFYISVQSIYQTPTKKCN